MGNECEVDGYENHDLDRTELTFPDGDEGRTYYCLRDGCGEIVPSVTTITGRRENPDKDRALKYWRKNNDGSDGNADFNHLRDYMGWRGTLFHFNVLSQLDSSLSTTDEEHHALRSVKDHSSNYPWVYSVLRNRAKKRDELDWFDDHFPTQSEYDGRMNPTLRTTLADDVDFATQSFFKHCDTLGLAAVGYDDNNHTSVTQYVNEHVRTENVLAVEKYIPTDDGYSGQLDLVYEKPSGEVVLCDLKNSGAIRYNYEMQLCAYANALDRDIDSLLVFRAHSDSQVTEIHWESDFNHSRSTYMSEFENLRDEVASLVQQLDHDSRSTEVSA